MASELLLRGVNSSFPSVDVGVDLYLDHGVRVQVKTTRLASRNSKGQSMASLGPAYRYTLIKFKGTFHKKGVVNEQRSWAPRQFSNEVDYVVLFGVDEDRFWIVPAALLDGRTGIVLKSRRSTAAYSIANAPFVRSLEAHEGRWDLLLPMQGEQSQTQVHSIGA